MYLNITYEPMNRTSTKSYTHC